MTAQAAFDQLQHFAATAPMAVPQFLGPEPLLPTPFRLATAAGAALGLVAAAAAELHRFRGGAAQDVAVDLGGAAALLLPEYRLNGTAIAPALPPTAATGFYQTGDGRWMHLHGGFAVRRKRLFDLLNAADDPAAVADAVGKWNGLALEDAAAYLGLAAALLRRQSEWQAIVPGRLIGAPLKLIKLAPGPKPQWRLGDSPLAGLKVLDLTRVVAGPLASALLASHGAEVLTVSAERLADADPFERMYAAGKRCTRLDLAEPAGAEALRHLARQADVFVDSYRPGSLARLGFSPPALAHLRPGMVAVSLSAYGLDGPWADRGGWEETTQAASGLAFEHSAFWAKRRGESTETPPSLLPGAPLCTITGMLAAAGTLAALLARAAEGGSWLVEVSLAATAAWISALGRIDAAAVPPALPMLTGLDQYRQSCETKDGWFETLGPVVRMAETPPQGGVLPEGFVSPHWASAHEEANADEIKPA